MADSAVIQEARPGTDILSAVPGSALHTATLAAPQKSKRVPALDFTKGALVLIMVLYHWMNYFIRADGDVYKYLRFLTPSFIFITGFLISQVYLSKKGSPRPNIRGRLLVRGLKLLAVVALLNIGLIVILIRGTVSDGPASSIAQFGLAFFLGMAPVAFSVLIPIAYLLIMAGVLLPVFRRHAFVFHIACALFVLSALLLNIIGISNGYLEIFSIGTLGISVGHFSMERVNRFVKDPAIMVLTYLLYLAAITVWNVIYPLQIIGVCLSVSLIYLLGIGCSESTYVGRVVVLLGQYSLFGYIAQIVILQLLRRGLHPLGLSVGLKASAFIGCLICTILGVVVLDRIRPKSRPINQVYTAVFC
ncbi:MAG TPA: acyltransferase family protein [Terriglobales bacterium]|jgi:peptidoglycan/LPS O-acetylase OafA/YrhL|nr:acyltransferase family protein [Terriglobales bacterium]